MPQFEVSLGKVADGKLFSGKTLSIQRCESFDAAKKKFVCAFNECTNGPKNSSSTAAQKVDLFVGPRRRKVTSEKAWKDSIVHWFAGREARVQAKRDSIIRRTHLQLTSSNQHEQLLGLMATWELAAQTSNVPYLVPLLHHILNLLETPDLNLHMQACGALWMLCVGQYEH
jgi:hypothetical protein